MSGRRNKWSKRRVRVGDGVNTVVGRPGFVMFLRMCAWSDHSVDDVAAYRSLTRLLRIPGQQALIVARPIAEAAGVTFEVV